MQPCGDGHPANAAIDLALWVAVSARLLIENGVQVPWRGSLDVERLFDRLDRGSKQRRNYLVSTRSKVI